MKFRDGDAFTSVYKNQDFVKTIESLDKDWEHKMNSVFMLHLQKGDEVKLKTAYGNHGGICVRRDHPLFFTGYGPFD